MLVIFVALSLLALAPAGAEDFIEPSINCAPERLRDDRFQVCTLFSIVLLTTAESPSMVCFADSSQGQDPGCDPRQGSDKGLLANWGGECHSLF